MNIFLVILINIFLMLIYQMFRNQWVYSQRKKKIYWNAGKVELDNYASYNTMLNKFWIWNIEKFRLDEKAKS